MLAVNCVLDTNVVVIGTPFHNTLLPLTKPVPFAVSVRGAVEALGFTMLGAVDGLNEVSVGGVAPDVPVTVSGS